MTERLVIIGGDAAGMSAAAQARRRRGPDDLEIVAFERGRRTSYSACGIPYWIGDVVDGPDELVARTPEVFRSEHAIDVRLRHEVTDIDTAARVVRARDLDGDGVVELAYDDLVYATGSVPIRPTVPGVDAPGVFGVQTLDDGEVLRGALAQDVSRVAVVGGGYIGLEIAEAMRNRGIDVTVIDREPQPLSRVDPDVGAVIADALRGLGINLVLGEPIVEVVTDGRGHAAGVRTDERTVDADLVVLGLGVRPATELAERAGIPLGRSGGVAVDLRMRTSVDGVWAAGDCVESMHRLTGRRVVVALGTHANKQGRCIGINIGGGYATFPGVIGTAATKVCDLEVARTGVSEREATEAGYRFVTAAIDSMTRAGYYPGAAPIRVKMIAERTSGRLLGAQIVGREGAAKRIDVLAAAIWNEMTVDEVVSLDLSYAPPFAPVWDPVLMAARKTEQAVAEAAQAAAHEAPSSPP